MRYPQTITHWKRTGADGFGGYTYEVPRFISARWEDRPVEISDDDVDLRRVKSIVWTEEPLFVGDYVFLGESLESDPTSLHDAFEVQNVRSTPSVDGSMFEYKATL